MQQEAIWKYIELHDLERFRNHILFIDVYNLYFAKLINIDINK